MMKSCVATILQAVLSFGGAIPSAAGSDVDVQGTIIIRLPSDGKDVAGGLVPAATEARKKGGSNAVRCCDDPACTGLFPSICFCLDKVEQCDDACKDCSQASSDPPRYKCNDFYTAYDNVPRCN